MDIVLAIIGVGIIGAIVFGVTQLKGLLINKAEEEHPELRKAREEIASLQTILSEEKSRFNELTGKNKQLFASHTELKAKADALQTERDKLEKRITQFEAALEQSRKDQDRALRDLCEAKESFEEEKLRIRREDEERLQLQQEERDRLWNDHENLVNALLTELCNKPDTRFESFSNTKLPSNFDGSLKPDFLIKFIDQYIIFDSKATKSDDIKRYIADAVKKTAVKIKGKPEIYPTVFFVIPSQAISSLKQTTFHEGGFKFHVIPPEALGPILATLKRMSDYEFAEKFDPEERENIVNLLAQFDHHIHARNAFDIIMAKHGSDILAHYEKMNPTLAKEVQVKKETIKAYMPNKSEVERLTTSTATANTEIDELISPQSKITKRNLKAAAKAQEVEMEF